MWMSGIHSIGSVKIAVGFLSRRHKRQYTVDIGFEFLVGICLQKIACTLYCLIDIGIVKRISSDFVRLGRMGSPYKVFISARLLAFAECQGNCSGTACSEALSPEIICYFHGGERHRSVRVSFGFRPSFRCKSAYAQT